MTSYSYNIKQNKTTNICPTGGYVQIDDTNYIFSTREVYENNKLVVQDGETLWIIKDTEYEWGIYKKVGQEIMSLRCKDFDDIMRIDASKLKNGDLIYVDRINSSLAQAFDDPKDLRSSEKTWLGKNKWLVLKYNEVNDSNINGFLYSPNGIAKQLNNQIIVYHGSVVKFKNGDIWTLERDYKYDIKNQQAKFIGIKKSEYDDDYAVREFINLEDVSDEYQIFASVIMNDDMTISSLRFNFPYQIERMQEKTINMRDIDSVFMVDNRTDETLSEVQLYDPIQGIIPNDVLKEVNYIGSYDPVNYNDRNTWDESREGYLWWDLSKVRYVDYHQGSNQYKRDNWGKQLPGSEIAIMEWTKTTTLPENIQKYTFKDVYDPTTTVTTRYYFYWLKNPTVVPMNDFRKISAFGISQIINSPQDMGIIWFAPLDVDYGRLANKSTDSTFIIGNYEEVAASMDFVVQINFRKDNETDEHEEWKLIKENSAENIPSFLWDKMKASLKGFKSDELGIKYNQKMFNNLYNARVNFVDVVNDVFKSRNVSMNNDAYSNEWKYVTQPDDSYKKYDIDEKYQSNIVESYAKLKRIIDKDLIGKYVKVNSDENYDGIWTVYYVNTLKDFKLIDYQKYDVQDGKFWTYEDMYENDNITPLLIPVKTLNSEAELNNYNFKDGDVIKIVGDRWILKRYNADEKSFETIGIQNGCIRLTDAFYSYMNDNNIDKEKIFIDGMTKYEYYDQQVSTIIDRIISYFEK